MKKHISFPRIEGDAARQAHCDLPEGTYEREFGKEGFFGPCSHLSHANPPTGWINWEGPLRPQAFDLNKLEGVSNTPWKAQRIMHNHTLDFRIWKTSGKMDHLACNGDGDDLLFVHSGEGSLFCDFGHMTFKSGDYIVLPRALRWRLECKGEATILLMEATNDYFQLPDKGMVGPHAIFDQAMLDVPKIDDAYKAQMSSSEEWNVVIKARGGLSTVTFPFNPLDVVSWHGDNLPVKINWRDIRPLMSHRYHLPPSAHTTFMTSRFVVCTFAPRPAEMDPGALKVPFYHSNNDFDEVIFYHEGEFFSRDNIHPGMLSFHPCGFPHGPHPKAFNIAAEADKTRKMTDPPKMLEEVAVMIDTRDAVELDDGIADTEWKGYVDSWKG
ncbi:MAG: homogentisate 1,2-dioxygenase [Rickettsiales bacterium]|nr:homogentisate 1,2-dioxygenase [Rickettsiales bacterium]